MPVERTVDFAPEMPFPRSVAEPRRSRSRLNLTCTDDRRRVRRNDRRARQKMSGMVADLTASYVHFATNDGQTHNVGTIVMLAGPVLIGLLAMYFVYNVTAA